ncbi:MAG: 3-deoxy-manno-octulosonate cytidylyltransferase [Puniceicoccales bacterium]|jgi:3-deoxy-manno-octulosonate cytidylyltransferase (CMP-KDO synthetase)|nr:3-deoxy-manno-octulosonate cytidylyltransferase [Puniceicoccales bacterium]
MPGPSISPDHSATVAIPARLASTRLPRKVLLDLGGKPVVQHVWERVRQMRNAARVVILADGQEVADAARAFGAEVFLTDPALPSGTARLASVLGRLPGAFFLNVQGDEPCIAPALLDALVERWRQTRCELVTAVAPLRDPACLANPNVVKVVRAGDGRALYFSRSPVPFRRGLPPAEWLADGAVAYWSHIGVYGYAREVLAGYPMLPVSENEKTESLEQLRFIEHGKCIQTVETDYHPVSIDTPEDLEKARALFSKG